MIYDIVTDGLVLQWVGNFIDSKRDINPVMLKCQISTSLSMISTFDITQFYLLKT